MLIGVTVASSIFALAEAIAKQSLWVRLLFLILPAGLYIYGFIQSNPSLVISSLGLFVGSGFLFFAPPTWQLSPISTDTLTNTQQSTIDRFYRRLFARSFLGLLVVSLLVLVLIGLESIAVHAGQNLGHASIARAQAVRLVAPSPLAIQAPQATTITINSTPTMIYSGLYLMLATSDRYYLFSCLTPTGGPDSLIMLNSDTDLTLEILPDVSPPAPCSGTPMPSSSPTPAAP